jgi:CHASE3 domain sensor protein
VSDLKDILNEEDDPRNDDLLKYIQGDLSKDEQYEVEKQIASSDFTSDAMDGLQQIRNKRSIDDYVDELNRQLQKQVSVKKQRKEKRKLKDNQWIVIAVVVVLGLCILGYAVIRYYEKHSVNKNQRIEQKS